TELMSMLILPRCSLEHHLRPFVVETEADLAQTGPRQRPPQPGLVLGVEHEKAATAGPDQLAAQGPVLARQIVPAVDVAVAHPATALFLVLPVDVHQLPEGVQIPLLECFFAPKAQILDEMKIVDHGPVGRFALVVLFLEDARGGTTVAGEK